jgi:uncharacterized protein YndB with AHSA1/START domain
VIDVVHEIVASRRTVGTGALATGTAHVVTISRSYAAGVDDLWDACTNAERIPRWFLPISGDLRVGGTYQLEGNAGGVIERCEPPTYLAATWEFDGNVSRIELQLTAEAGGRTRLEIRHTLPDDDHWREFGPGATGVGWDLTVMGLGLHLATGQAVDQVEMARWSSSADGRQFVTESSRSWGEADVAAGTASAVAEAMAARTAAAYVEH